MREGLTSKNVKSKDLPLPAILLVRRLSGGLEGLLTSST